MGNLFLVFALLSSLSIVFLLKIYEKKGYDRYVIIASNYLIAGSMGFIFLEKNEFPKTDVLIFGIIIGFLFFFSFSIFSMSLKKKGIAPTVTFGRLSLAIPVLFSIFLWGESPSEFNIISLILIFTIILIWEKRVRSISLILLILFFLFGFIDTSMKYFKIRFPEADNNVFLIVLFYSALLWGWAYIIFSKRRVRKVAFFNGLALGIPNFFSSYFVLLALSRGIPAYVTFPFINIGIIILSALLGKIFFKETLSFKQTVLILLGTVAIVLLSL